MTFMTNRSTAIAVSIVTAMFVGQLANTASAQVTETIDSTAVETEVANFTADTSAQLSDRLAEPTLDISAKLVVLDERSTIKPDYAAYRQENGDEEEQVVLASSR